MAHSTARERLVSVRRMEVGAPAAMCLKYVRYVRRRPVRAARTQSCSRNAVRVNTEQHRFLLDPLLERVVVKVEQTAGEW